MQYGKIVHKDVNNCGGLLLKVKLAVVCRVILTQNINVSGAWCTLRREVIEEGKVSYCVLTKFYDFIGRRLKYDDGCVEMTPTFAIFQATKYRETYNATTQSRYLCCLWLKSCVPP